MWIYLTRHAETEGNISRIVQTPNTPLTPRGTRQAEALANRYSQLNIQSIICSDYLRTQDSAKPTHERLSCRLYLEPLLRERNFGDLRGKRYSEIDAEFFAKNYSPPNGESYPEFVIRVKKAWQSILDFCKERADSSHAGDVMVMTHGLVVRCILTEILRRPQHELDTIDVQNTCVTKINSTNINDVPLICDLGHLQGELLNDDLQQGKQGAV
jgi:broad specificity phosphatase PhoE